MHTAEVQTTLEQISNLGHPWHPKRRRLKIKSLKMSLKAAKNVPPNSVWGNKMPDANATLI
jgi:hypothetical protein